MSAPEYVFIGEYRQQAFRISHRRAEFRPIRLDHDGISLERMGFSCIFDIESTSGGELVKMVVTANERGSVLIQEEKWDCETPVRVEISMSPIPCRRHTEMAHNDPYQASEYRIRSSSASCAKKYDRVSPTGSMRSSGTVAASSSASSATVVSPSQ